MARPNKKSKHVFCDRQTDRQYFQMNNIYYVMITIMIKSLNIGLKEIEGRYSGIDKLCINYFDF